MTEPRRPTKREVTLEWMRKRPDGKLYRVADGPLAGEMYPGAPGIMMLVCQMAPEDSTLRVMLGEPALPADFTGAGVPIVRGRYDLEEMPDARPIWRWTDFRGWTEWEILRARALRSRPGGEERFRARMEAMYRQLRGTDE